MESSWREMRKGINFIEIRSELNELWPKMWCKKGANLSMLFGVRTPTLKLHNFCSTGQNELIFAGVIP